MVKVTPQAAAEKLVRRLGQSTADITAGVNRVTEAPGVKAAANQDKMIASLMEAVNSGKWARRVSGVSLAEWKKATLEKGVPRIAAGVAASQGKIQDFYAEFFPFLERIQNEIEAMPNATAEDRINRAVHYMRESAKFERSG
ncbi:hypothetical protein CMI37_15750 [Candidatus Pacearchaeota archaeon]|nr:hypothetical protein [Candidatus Pacearchaeota archaeon]|tara:strand:- start:408 stop:833 length:426 start_codon:yes stop_codon:yes gene_type:complete